MSTVPRASCALLQDGPLHISAHDLALILFTRSCMLLSYIAIAAALQGASSEALRPLLERAISTAQALHNLNTKRIELEVMLHEELKSLVDKKEADVARTRQRAEASSVTLQGLQARLQGGSAPVWFLLLLQMPQTGGTDLATCTLNGCLSNCNGISSTSV